MRITRACVCGSDLWPYRDLPPTEQDRRMAHEAIGVIEVVGRDIHKIWKGDFVLTATNELKT